jgi:hypothetical protein
VVLANVSKACQISKLSADHKAGKFQNHAKKSQKYQQVNEENLEELPPPLDGYGHLHDDHSHLQEVLHWSSCQNCMLSCNKAASILKKKDTIRLINTF